MTLIQAAEALGVSVSTLRTQIKLGVLKARKLGRDWIVEPKEVERYRLEHRRAVASAVMKATT
jgi:excisionase family DNA binding protein